MKNFYLRFFFLVLVFEPIESHLLLAKEKQEPSLKPRVQTLEFEDEVVESFNKNPFHSMQVIGDQDSKNRSKRLYQKKTHMKQEIQKVLQEMKYLP